MKIFKVKQDDKNWKHLTGEIFGDILIQKNKIRVNLPKSRINKPASKLR